MPSPLASGVLPFTEITARLQAVPYPTGSCPTNLADFGAWVASFPVVFSTQVAFGYTSGPLSEATPEQRPFPRLIFTDAGLFVGLGVWDTTLGAWVTGAVLGELKTIVRTSDTVEQDLVVKGLEGAGWHLADGTTTGIPNLTANTGFFTGTTPNWDVYTVGYTGT